MPFARPTLVELIERAASDIETQLPGTDARLRRSNLGVIARVHAGGTHGLYGFLDFMAKQLMPDTAETTFLERHANVYGLTRTPAEYANGNVTLPGLNGAVVPAGRALQRADGAVFFSTADATVAGGLATVGVIADEPGSAGNANAGVAMTLAEPVEGVESAGVVASGGLVGGADAETDAALRARLLGRIQSPPNGGSASDYVAWALQVPGVTRAWVYPLELGVGTVVVRFVRDNDVSFIPDGGEVAAVQSHIDVLRPVCAQVTVAAPTAVPLALTIELTPDTTAVRNAVQAELADLLKREAAPGATILLSHIREVISLAAGETNHVLTVPSADVTHTSAQIATLGTITWV